MWRTGSLNSTKGEASFASDCSSLGQRFSSLPEIVCELGDKNWQQNSFAYPLTENRHLSRLVLIVGIRSFVVQIPLA